MKTFYLLNLAIEIEFVSFMVLILMNLYRGVFLSGHDALRVYRMLVNVFPLVHLALIRQT